MLLTTKTFAWWGRQLGVKHWLFSKPTIIMASLVLPSNNSSTACIKTSNNAFIFVQNLWLFDTQHSNMAGSLGHRSKGNFQLPSYCQHNCNCTAACSSHFFHHPTSQCLVALDTLLLWGPCNFGMPPTLHIPILHQSSSFRWTFRTSYSLGNV